MGSKARQKWQGKLSTQISINFDFLFQRQGLVEMASTLTYVVRVTTDYCHPGYRELDPFLTEHNLSFLSQSDVYLVHEVLQKISVQVVIFRLVQGHKILRSAVSIYGYT